MPRLNDAERLARELVHLKRAAHAHEVVRREASRAFGIYGGETGMQRRASLALREHAVSLAHRGIGRGRLDETVHHILGTPLPYIRMPVASGRNLSILVEIAARNHVLKVQGHFSAHEFARQLEEQLERKRGRKAGEGGGQGGGD